MELGSVCRSVVAGAVGGYLAPTLAASHIGGFVGGAITGASSGFTAGLTSGIINNRSIGALFRNSFKSALIGGITGGIIGGIDAAFKGHNFWDGKGIPTDRYILGTGNTPKTTDIDINSNEGIEQIISNSDVNSLGNPHNVPQGRGVGSGINTQNFKGNLSVKVRAFPKPGEKFYIKVDGKEVFSTNIRGERVTLSLKAGNSIQWGISGPRYIQPLVFTTDPSSYLIIQGIHRSWGGFLSWH